jgi:catechol 2,3-dioxygenase
MLDDPLPSDTRIGHIHLHVRDIKEALDFYHGIIGFDIMGVSHGIGLAFVSAGGYHHHIGLNTWLGKDIPPAPEGALGLEYFSVDLPDQKALDQVAARLDAAGISALERENGLLVGDPSQINLLFKVK